MTTTARHRLSTCEAALVLYDPFAGHSLIPPCGKPATFHPGRGPFGFGLYLCNEHTTHEGIR